MKRISNKILRNAYNVINSYKSENEGKNYKIGSFIQYCVENEIRAVLRENKIKENQIDEIFKTLELNVSFQIDKIEKSVSLKVHCK